MIPVSSAWKAAQNEILLPEMFVEISYEITEPGLQEEAVATGSNPEDFSNVAQVVSRVDKNSEKYATLDYGCWGLDGNFSYTDKTPVDPGYVDKNYSGADGSMSVHPMITIDFAKKHDAVIPGITITWSTAFTGWATDFKVSAYDASGMVATTTVVGNTSVVSNVILDMAGYSKITIEILKWSHPYQRVRCTDILLGLGEVYTKADLLGYEHNQSVDLLSAKLPESSISFKLRNDDERWNPDSPSGSVKYLLEQQEIRVRYGMKIGDKTEWIKGGTYWLSEWNTPTNGLEADFTARDSIDFMAKDYTGPRVGTLYDIAVSAFEEANLTLLDNGEKRYIVDESLKDVSTDFSDEGSTYTIAEILQMVANAGCCVFYQDRDGVVHIEPRNKTYSGYKLEPRISYAHPEYTISKPLKAISVDYEPNRQKKEVEVASRGEVQTVSNPLIVGEKMATAVGETAKELLENRKEISGSFRADLRLDALDNIVVVSKYASNVICLTDVSYSTTGGAFKGEYTGKVVSINLDSVKVYSNEIRSGEIW